MNRYVKTDRGAGGRAGQILRHIDDPKRWQVKVFAGRDGRGKKRYVSEHVYGSKRDAEAVLTEMLQRKNQGRLSPRTHLKLSDLVEEWAKKKAREVSPRTMSSYRKSLDSYILPTLGNRRLDRLTLRDIDNLYGLMHDGSLPPVKKNGKTRTIKPLRGRTITIAHTALNQALKQAVRWGMIPYNPAAEAAIPRSEKQQKRPLAVAERKGLIAASSDSFYRTFYRVLLDTGMRPGEACALNWTDLDFERGSITITKAITQGHDNERVVAHPKTSKSRRTLPMFGLDNELLAHRASQAQQGLGASGYVFTNQLGAPIAPWNFSKRDLERVAKVAGITWTVTLYTFRHTFATLHLQFGTPLKVVSEYLGHSTIQQTANTYQHLSQEVSMDYAERFVAKLAEASRATGKTAPPS